MSGWILVKQDNDPKHSRKSTSLRLRERNVRLIKAEREWIVKVIAAEVGSISSWIVGLLTISCVHFSFWFMRLFMGWKMLFCLICLALYLIQSGDFYVFLRGHMQTWGTNFCTWLYLIDALTRLDLFAFTWTSVLLYFYLNILLTTAHE